MVVLVSVENADERGRSRTGKKSTEKCQETNLSRIQGSKMLR